MALQLQNPTTLLLAGSSGSGKTSWVFRLIDQIDEIFVSKIERIHYFYKVWQPKFDDYVEKIHFHEGLPDKDLLHQSKNCLLILDDLMHENLNIITQIFTVYSHHCGFSALFLAQNIFHKNIREISLNAHIVVLFKNSRDIGQIKTFLRQAFPEKPQVLQAYKSSTTQPYGYLLLDFRVTTPENERIRTNVFTDEINYIYQ